MAQRSPNDNIKEPDDEFFDTFFDDGVLETIGEVLGHHNSGTSHDESSCEAQDPSSLGTGGEEINLPQSDTGSNSVGSHADKHHVIVIKPAHIKDPFENLRTEESFKKSVTSSREMVLIERPGTSVEMAAPSSNESKNDCERQSTLSLNQLLAKVQNFLKETPGSEIKSSENSNKQVDENHPPVVPNSIEEQGNQVTSEMSEIHNKQLGMEGVVKNAKSTTVFKTKCGSADTELDVNAPTTNQISSSSLSSSPICNVTLSSNDCFDIAPKESLPKTYAVKEKDLSVNGTCLKNDYLQLSPPGKRNKININLKSQILASTSILNSGSSTTSEPQLFSQGNCDEIPSKSHVLYSDMSSTDDSSTENRELKKKKKKRMKGHGDQDIFRNSKSAEKELKSNEAHGKKKKKKRKHSPEQRRNRDHNISSKRQRSRSSEQKNLSRKEYKRGTSPNVSMRNKRQRSPMPNRYSKHKSGSPSRHRSKSPVRHRSRKSPSPRKNRRRSRSRSRSPFINEIRRLEKLWEQEDERKKFSFNPESWTAPSSQVPAWPDGGTTSTAFVSQTVLQMQSATFTIGPLTDRSNPAYQEGSAALIGPGGCHSFPAPPPNFTDSPYAMPPFETFAAHSGVPRMVLQQPEVPGLAPYQSGVPGVTPYPLVCTPPLVPQMVPPPSSIVTSSNNVTGQQSILRRQLDILKSVMPPAPVMPPVTAPPMLPAPVNKLRPSLHEVEINNTQSQKNITCEAVNTESPPLELIGTNCIEISGQCSSKSKSDGIIEKSLPSREGNSNSSSQASAQDIAIETLNDNCSSESHKSRSDILTEKLGVSSNKAIEVPDIPQIMNPMEYENQNEDDEIGVIVEDYDSDIIIEETPPKPPIELICLSEDEGDAILPEACDKEPNKNYKSHEIYPTNEEGTEKTISVDSTPAERACAMTGAPPPAVLVTSVSSGLQTLNQTSEEVTMAKQLIPQVLPIESCQNASSMKQFEPLELQTKNHHRKKRKRSKRSSVEDDEHVGKEKQRESEKLLVSNEDESQESNKNCERHKIHPVNEEIMKEFNEVRSKSTSVEPTSQETSVTLLTPSEVLETPESPISQTFKKASNEINMQKQTSPQVTSKESPNPVICPYGSSMKECESLESQTRKHKKKKRKRRSSEDKTCRRLGKENLEEPMNLSVSNQDESQDSVLRECREMIDSLRIGRFAVKYQDCDESEKTGTFLPKEPTGSNSPLVENIVHFSYTKTLKPESLPKVKDVSTNTIFRLCLDVCTNTDTNVTSKDCILQTDFECHQCIEKKDLIRDMNAQLMKLKKERDDLRAIVVGLGKYHTIPGLDLPSEEAQDNNFHQQSGLEFTSSEREFVENGPSFSSEQTGCNFELMPPAVPIFAYDYNHSSPSRSGVCSKRDSYLCPKKPFQ